jgi:23S rRNA pseudouridine2457 synthase
MAQLVLFNKPFQVLSQFRSPDHRICLKNYLDIPEIYPAGRLDYDSEGLLLLTDSGELQARIAHPRYKLPKTYLAQVEGEIDSKAIDALTQGVLLKDGMTKPARACRITEPNIWPRKPPVRERLHLPTSWLELTITEGRNRQVRRMTAQVGFPTLRLVRISIGPWTLDNLSPGAYRCEQIHLPRSCPTLNRPERRPRTK